MLHVTTRQYHIFHPLPATVPDIRISICNLMADTSLYIFLISTLKEGTHLSTLPGPQEVLRHCSHYV